MRDTKNNVLYQVSYTKQNQYVDVLQPLRYVRLHVSKNTFK